jgi:hypothetical protein
VNNGGEGDLGEIVEDFGGKLAGLGLESKGFCATADAEEGGAKLPSADGFAAAGE